jgi:hypothetical protein
MNFFIPHSRCLLKVIVGLVKFTYLMLKTSNNKPLKLDEIHILLQTFVEKKKFNVRVMNVPIIVSYKSHHAMNNVSFCN